jgi:hypothetical protein
MHLTEYLIGLKTVNITIARYLKKNCKHNVLVYNAEMVKVNEMLFFFSMQQFIWGYKMTPWNDPNWINYKNNWIIC